MTTQTTKQNNKKHEKIMELIWDIKRIRFMMRNSMQDEVWDSLAKAWSKSARLAYDIKDEFDNYDTRQEYTKMILDATNEPIGGQY
jgi:hypothetical protein